MGYIHKFYSWNCDFISNFRSCSCAYMPTIFDTVKETCYILCVVIFGVVVTNLATYLVWGFYVWPVLYEDIERTILVGFLFGWIDAREL